MKKNLRTMIEVIREDTPRTLLDMNDYDMIESTGMTPDLVHKKNAHMTAAWHTDRQPHVVIPMGGSDLSGFRYLTLSVFSVGATGDAFTLMFDNSSLGDGRNGYQITLPVMHEGWNDYRIELPFLNGVRQPLGWDKIGSILLTSVRTGAAVGKKPILYLDSFLVYEQNAAPLYTKLPELKGAAAFSRTGSFSIVDRKRIANSLDGAPAKPFEEDGILWLPMAPVAACMAHSAVVDNRAMTLSFTYRRKKYRFAADADTVMVDEETAALGFFPKESGGTLFFPADYVREFFRWRQIYIDPMGLVVLSNRRGIFQGGKDPHTIRALVADLTLLRPDGERILSDLHRRFPNANRGRLLLSYDELMQLRRDAKEDPNLGEYVMALKAQYGIGTPAYLSEPFVAGLPRDAAMLTEDLTRSSELLLAFSTLYRVTGDKKYCERAAAECEALAECKDWNLQSMSTVGTVSLAVAIAYDWCHHVWSESRKAVVERSMLRNGMRVGLDTYLGKRRMWVTGGAAAATANAGMLAMALALADVYPETSHRLLDRILSNVEPCLSAFAPDGGYPEGVAAWEKAFRAICLIIAMLRKATGEDYGLLSMPGLSATAYFPTTTETSNGIWNIHNSDAHPADTSMMSWFSRQIGDPVPAWLRRRQLLAGEKTVHPFDILFYCPVDDMEPPHLPMDAVWRRAGLAVMRSGWGREDAFLGLHGGSNREVNGDLDAGSVILDMGGVRFFSETGGIEALPVMLRRRAEGQNTVVINPAKEPAPDQNPDAAAKLIEMRSAPERAYAVVDMTSTCDAILRGKRGVMLTNDRTTAVIQDELVLKAPGELLWTVYTPAAVTVSGGGKIARLEKDGKTLLCKVGGLGAAKLTAEEVPGCNLTRLSIRVSVGERVRLSVACRLLGEGEALNQSLYELTPIANWGNIE